jgi:glycogen operon protein
LLIEDEQGSKQRVVLSLDGRDSFRAFDGQMASIGKAQLPALPMGRYILTLEGNNATPCHLTVAPPACFLPKRLLAGAVGLSAQLYTLRRQEGECGDQGIGDFTMLGEIGAAAGHNGFACLGLNPMHALMTRNRERASPYHPSDRNFLDPIYLDLEDMAGVTGLPLQFDKQRAQTLANLPDVDYPAVWAFKEQALRRHFETCQRLWAKQPSSGPAQDFAAFIAAGGAALRKFACFEILVQQHDGADWRDWPPELRNGEATALARIERENAEDWRFILFQQWLCERQLAAAAARAKEGGLWMGFYRDMAVGAAPDGGEGWANAGLYLHGVSVGAPPDPLAEGGQIWHLPPPEPLKMAAQGFRSFADLLRSNMRHAGALRIDHALGLMRLFLVPYGMPALAGAYLSYPLDDLLAQVALESHRAHCVVIGEDLGTVPEGFRAKLETANILSYRVLWFERWAENFAPAEAYPPKAVACAATHDLPTLAGWWQGADIAEKAALGLISPGLAADDMQRRRDDRRRLLETLAAEGLAPTSVDFDAPLSPAMLDAIHAFLQKTPAILAMVQIDDLMGETRGVNLPGTDRERPNWRRKLQGSALASLARPGLARRE